MGKNVIKVNPYFNKASRPIIRIVGNLIRYKPDWVSIVDNDDDADVTLLHINGRVEGNTRRSQKCDYYVAIQYCLKTTKTPNVKDWVHIWNNAAMVWSYYDLGIENQYHSALGVDSSIFYQREFPKRDYKICVVGHGYLFESVREIIYATGANNQRMAFVGEMDRKFDHVDVYTNISDYELSILYSRSEYVSGLRRIEGFELPAAEGACCGAVPVLYDLPCYRDWYDGIGKFIVETNRAGIIQDLIKLLDNKPDNSCIAKEAQYRFNWETIINGFWENLKQNLKGTVLNG